MSTNRYSLELFKAILEKELGKELSPSNLAMLKLAFFGHALQFRESVKKDEKIPFVVHPVGVAVHIIKHFPIVKAYLKDDLDTLVTAALAHDLLEDTRVTRNQIESIGGKRVLRLVESMTKLPSSGHVDLSKRNKEVVVRTLAVGPSAVFLRTCDSMHNLSWPQVTPYKLLGRTIQKSKNIYLPLLDKVKIGKKLKEEFILKIEKAEDYFSQAPLQNLDLEIPKTIDEAIKLCAFFTHKKILEIHDIVEILKRVTGADNASSWSLKSEESGIIHLAISEGKEMQFSTNIKRGNIDFVTKEIFAETIKFFLPKSKLNGRYFLLNLSISSSSQNVILLVFEDNNVPAWGTTTNFEFLMDSLSERLIIANADYKKTLAGVASELRIQFEENWADKLPIEAAHFSDIEEWRNLCAQAIRQVIHACEVFFEQEARNYPLRDLIKIESRVKEASSIIRKFLPPSPYDWPKFDKLADIAGVRVICPDKKIVSGLKKYLSGSTIRHLGIVIHPDYLLKDYTKKPTIKGYRAIHIILQVETYLQKKIVKVPCEIQLQTMIQDVWAKIAHRVSYKKENRANDTERKLREIGKNLDNLDELIENLTEGK